MMNVTIFSYFRAYPGPGFIRLTAAKRITPFSRSGPGNEEMESLLSYLRLRRDDRL